MKRSKKNAQSGVMLIEALVAMLILSFGILGLVSLQAVATKNAIGAEDRTKAANLANELISQMWLTNSSTPASGDITVWNSRIAASGLPSGAGAVTTSGNVTTITVSWVSRANNFKVADVAVPHQYVTQFPR